MQIFLNTIQAKTFQKFKIWEFSIHLCVVKGTFEPFIFYFNKIKKIKLIAILHFSKQTTHLTECLYHPCHSSVECTGWLRMVSSQVDLVSNQYWDCR